MPIDPAGPIRHKSILSLGDDQDPRTQALGLAKELKDLTDLMRSFFGRGGKDYDEFKDLHNKMAQVLDQLQTLASKLQQKYGQTSTWIKNVQSMLKTSQLFTIGPASQLA